MRKADHNHELVALVSASVKDEWEALSIRWWQIGIDQCSRFALRAQDSNGDFESFLRTYHLDGRPLSVSSDEDLTALEEKLARDEAYQEHTRKAFALHILAGCEYGIKVAKKESKNTTVLELDNADPDRLVLPADLVPRCFLSVKLWDDAKADWGPRLKFDHDYYYEGLNVRRKAGAHWTGGIQVRHATRTVCYDPLVPELGEMTGCTAEVFAALADNFTRMPHLLKEFMAITKTTRVYRASEARDWDIRYDSAFASSLSEAKARRQPRPKSKKKG